MTITINNVGVSTGNVLINPNSIGIVKIVNYTDSTGANLSIELPDPAPGTVIPLEDVTSNVIIGWITAITSNSATQ